MIPSSFKRIFASAALLCLAQSVWAQPPPVASSAPVTAAELSQKSDTELTQLTAQWSHLSPSERRNLLAEVRGRMAANKANKAKANKIAQGSIGIRVQRRYGRLVRKPDGSVVMQTRVVEMRPTNPTQGPAQVLVQPSRSADGTLRARVTFGIGFEQRVKSRVQRQQPLHTPPSGPPSVTVSQAPQSDQAP